MARARNIKPGFFLNDSLAECDMATRLLFVGLWTLADRRGILEDRPKKIKAAIFPFDGEVNIDECLSRLDSHGFITRYRVADQDAILINNFEKHQNPHVREPESTVPAPDGHQSPKRAPDQHRAKTGPATPITDSLLPLTDSPLPITEVSAKQVGYPAAFEEFWTAYPNHNGSKRNAFDQWRKLRTVDRHKAIEALPAWELTREWRDGFVKHAERYLRDRLFDQSPDPAPPRTNGKVSNAPDFLARAEALRASTAAPWEEQ